MKNVKSTILYGIIAACGAAAAIIPLAVYRLIETAGAHGSVHSMAMPCETACLAAAIIGAIIVVIAIVSLLLKKAIVKITGSALLLAGGAAVIAVPRVFGLCVSLDMACRYITEPTLIILGLAIVILSIVQLTIQVISVRKASVIA